MKEKVKDLEQQLRAEKAGNQVTKTRLVALQDQITELEAKLDYALWRETEKLYSYSLRTNANQTSANPPTRQVSFFGPVGPAKQTQTPPEPGYYIDIAVWQNIPRN